MYESHYVSGNSLLHLLSPQPAGLGSLCGRSSVQMCSGALPEYNSATNEVGYAQPTTPKECLRPTLRSSWCCCCCWGYNFLASPSGFVPASVKLRQMYAQHERKPGLRFPLYRGPSNVWYPWCLRWRLWEIRDYLLAYQQIGGGTTNSKPLGAIIMMGQSNTLSSCQMSFISPFYRVTEILCLLPVTASCAIILRENNFPEPNWHILSFLHPILLRTITYWAPLEILLERGPCTYTYKQGWKSIHKKYKACRCKCKHTKGKPRPSKQ